MMQDEVIDKRNIICEITIDKGSVFHPFGLACLRGSQILERYLNSWMCHIILRWVCAGVLVLIFVLRILLTQAWYPIAYVLAGYFLRLFLDFLRPKVDPVMGFDDADGPELPTKSNEEFRPFIRQLPEFKCWYQVCKSTVIAFILTLFKCTDIPVLWPPLIIFYIGAFCVMMMQEIKKMIKYRYLPFTFGKPMCQNHDDGAKLTII